MTIFSKVKQCIKTSENGGISVCIDVALPAINKTITDKDGNETVKTVADPELSAQQMFDTLSEYWDESFLKKQMLSRFIAVVCMDRIRREIIKQVAANPTVKVDKREEFAQQFADEGWNKSLSHPETDRKQASQARKEKDLEEGVSEMPESKLEQLLAKRGLKLVKS